MEIYGRLLRSVAFPAWQAMRKTGPMLARLDYLERTQWRSLDELIAIQCGALSQLLRTLYRDHAPTRARFDAAGISPDDIRDANDLIKLPVTTQCSGPPLAGSDVRRWQEAVDRRFFSWSRHRLGHQAVHYSYDRPRSSKPRAFIDRYVRRDVRVSASPGNEGELRAAVDVIKSLQTQTIFCDSRAAGELARYVVDQGLRDLRNIRVICGVDGVSKSDRDALEMAFGDAVFETRDFGSAMLLAGECEAHVGLHVAIEGVVIEIVVTDAQGKQRDAREGEVGDVVVTELHDTQTPSIRFFTGARARCTSRGRCSCGRGLPRIDARV